MSFLRVVYISILHVAFEVIRYKVISYKIIKVIVKDWAFNITGKNPFFVFDDSVCFLLNLF